MKYISLILVFLLEACAHQPAKLCPPLPQIGQDQSIKDYTVHLVEMYNTCAAQKN